MPEIEGYEFGPYRIDTGERLLHRGDALVSLPPKVAGTLLVLVQNAGRMVDKGELMKAVWPDTFVEDGALTRNISLLRKTLGEAGEATAYIETIPKRGYRFVAPVRAVAYSPAATTIVDPYDTSQPVGEGQQTGTIGIQPVSSRAAAKWKIIAGILLLIVVAGVGVIAVYAHRNGSIPLAGPITVPGNALAVIPFRSIGQDASQDYFANGVTQDLIARLTDLGRRLRVVSLASEAGELGDAAVWNAIRELSVQRVLTGTVARSGGRVRIDAKLIDPVTRTEYWLPSSEGDLHDLLALESSLAESIAGEIQVSISAEERERLRHRRPVRPEALDAYLLGRSFWNRRTEDGLWQAVKYFNQAIAADPTYALAYSGLADSYSLLGSIGVDGMPPKKAMPLARTFAQKAIDLDPYLADGRISLAYVKLSYDWDLRGAAREFARGLALNPNSATGRHWYSHYFMAAGNLTQATEQMRAAMQLEPLSSSINIGVGWCLYYSRQYEQAIKRFRLVAEMDPSLPLARQTLGMAYQQNGQFDAAIEEFKLAAALSGNSPASVSALASAYAAQGKTAQARQELARLEKMSRTRHVPAFYFATVHYAMGDLPGTISWGWTAFGEHCDYLIYLPVEPRAGKLAGNPDFIRVMAALHR